MNNIETAELMMKTKEELEQMTMAKLKEELIRADKQKTKVVLDEKDSIVTSDADAYRGAVAAVIEMRDKIFNLSDFLDEQEELEQLEKTK